MGPYRVSKRTFLMSIGALAAWRASPVRASLAAAGRTPLPARLEALLGRMTLAEKAGQLTIRPAVSTSAALNAVNPVRPRGFDAQIADIRAGRLMGVFNHKGAETARQLQTTAIQETRLRIPLMFGADVLHGYQTVFPVPLGEAASFDPSLAERTARAAAAEMSATGIDWTFAPMVDISRDARWGRGVEGSGEDVLLSNQMAAARVKGFQGRSLRDADAVLACPKHFAGYGASEGGLDYNTVDISERTMREVYLPPFKAAFAAGALSTMTSFNEVSGTPATADPWLLDQVLRDEWGFDGIVITDSASDEDLIAHGFAADAREAAKLAFLAGVDVSMTSGLFIGHLPGLVESGEVPISRVDQAVRRVLALKEKLGLFEDPFRRIDPPREAARMRTPAHLALAREAARRSIVMLKNDNDLLPLPRIGRKIAVIGPFADAHSLNGPWAVYAGLKGSVGLATGLRAAVSDASLITVELGSDVERPLEGGIDRAVIAARAADVVILAVGESTGMSGESQSRAQIVLPPAQQALATAVAATGKPIVVVLKNGRALALEGSVLNAPAILVTWFLGSEGGHAIAEILFGVEGPSGRLPVSFPANPGQTPYYYSQKSSGKPNPPGKLQPFKTHYRDVPQRAAFPFGHGLTYGRISYADMSVAPNSISQTGRVTISATIFNQGSREAVEVAQLYVQDVTASVTRPVRELKAYQRVTLAAGESKKVTFSLSAADLSFLGRDLKPRSDAGLFRVWIAPSAESEGVGGEFRLLD